jgi:conjugative transfer region protein TrbK
MIEEPVPQRRFVLPGWRALAAGGAAAGVGIVALLALLALRDPAPEPSRFAVTTGAEVSTSARVDPLMAELLRCRELPAGSDDAACREAWEVNRRRFMGETRSYVAPVAAASLPATAPIPSPTPSPAAER